jgi:hypothetical protein
MKVMKAILSGAALFVLSAPAMFAESATTNETPQTIQQRKENQQDRIAQGVQSGQLTAGETKNLETKEAGLNKEKRTMRSEDDGHLTAADRAKLNNQQNRLSNRIYDGGKLTAADKKTVNQQQNQASRNIYNKKHNGRRQ